MKGNGVLHGRLGMDKQSCFNRRKAAHVQRCCFGKVCKFKDGNLTVLLVVSATAGEPDTFSSMEYQSHNHCMLKTAAPVNRTC